MRPPLQTLPWPQALFNKEESLQLFVMFNSGWSPGVIHSLAALDHDRMHRHDQHGPQSALPAIPLATCLLHSDSGGPLSCASLHSCSD